MQPWTVEQKIQGTSSHGLHIKAVFRPDFSDRISTEDGSATPVHELNAHCCGGEKPGEVKPTLVQLAGERWWLMGSWD